MTEVTTSELQLHVERLHDCRAEYREAVAVREEFEGEVAWEGTVHVYSLSGHPSASICYAWSSPVERSKNRRFCAVLHADVVDSPAKAVRAAIVTQYQMDPPEYKGA